MVVKCISMIITKTASRNVAFKSVKLAESVFTSQADVLTEGLSSLTIAKRILKTWVIMRICIFLIKMIDRIKLLLISVSS